MLFGSLFFSASYFRTEQLALNHTQCEKHDVDNLLLSLFKPTDWELYALVQGPVTDLEILSRALIIDQTGATEASDSVRSLLNLRSVAVIDRTADVKKAAQQILSFHLAFSGQSPHAPDLIVVNEWVKSMFIDTMTREQLSGGREVNSINADANDAAWKKAVVEVESKG